MSQGVERMAPGGKAFGCAVAAVVALLGLLASDAAARNLYVPNGRDVNSVSVIDTDTNQLVGSPIGVQERPFAIAITPDGSRAYVTNIDSGSVSVIDTRSNTVVGAPIKVGTTPFSIAITPDGSRAYVANLGSGNVSVIDTRSNTLVGAPIEVEKEPYGIAITPDGSRAYVTNIISESISVIDLATNVVVATLRGASINEPAGVGISADGSRVYVADTNLNALSVFDARTNQAVSSIPGLNDAEFVAISPDGRRVYVTDGTAGTISAVDAQSNQVLGVIDRGPTLNGLTLSPDGGRLYASYSTGISVIDTQANLVVAGPLLQDMRPEQIAIVPNQPPAASFMTPRARPGVPVAFSASSSKDPDGTVATYAWGFGDKKTASATTPRTNHVYPRPGKYPVTLTLTDNEGCSTALVFTGQTASCNGAAVATKTEVIRVAYPGVQVRCPRSAKPGGCRFKLQVVSKRGKKAKAQSAVARVRLKAGGSTIASLKPRKAFRRKLARAKRVLVERTQTIDGSTRTTVRKLKIVQ